MAEHPNSEHWYFAADASRLELVACTICPVVDRPCEERTGSAWYHAGRRWDIEITAPGWGNELPAQPGPCAPTVEARWTRIDDRQHQYRGACLGCGWAGPCHLAEQHAVEDAHDHAYPRWRQLPAIERPQLQDAARAQQRWLADARAVYRIAGLDPDLLGSGWPLRTLRHGAGTRSHWCHIIGGYDIYAGQATPTTSAEQHVEQLSLFDTYPTAGMEQP